MRIGIKILFSFAIIIVSIAVMGFLTITTSQERLIDNIGQDYSEALVDAVDQVDKNLAEKTIGLIDFSERNTVIESLIESNSDTDPSEILTISQQWNEALESGTDNDLIDEIKHSELSSKLEFASNLIETRYGLPVYDQIQLINKFGALVGFVGSTPSYYYQEAEWWDKVISDGFFVGEVEYDSDTQVYFLDVAIRIDDSSQDPVGVLKTRINIQDILVMVNELKQKNKFLGSDISLLDRNGMVLYSTGKQRYGDNIPLVEFVLMSERSDYFLTSDAGHDVIKVYAKTNNEPFDLGWIFVIQKNTDEILKPVVGLTNIILIVLTSTLASALIIGIYVRNSISKPLITLRDASMQIAEGNFDVTFDIKTDDEVGDLANKFAYMRDSINFTNENLNDLVRIRTNEFEKAMEDIKKMESWRKNVVEYVSRAIQQPFNDLATNSKLLKEGKIDKDKAVPIIEDSLLHLKSVISTIVDLYALEQGKLNYDMNDSSLNEIIDKTLQSLKNSIKSSINLVFELGADITIFADKQRLGQAIRTIVENMLKNMEEGTITVKTSSTKKDAKIYLISDKRLDESKFLPLKKGHQEHTSDLALYVAGIIINDHAGKIEVIKYGDGTAIIITMPVF